MASQYPVAACLGERKLKVGILRGPFGNVTSITNAFEYLGADVYKISEPGDLHGISHVVIPGVGSFSAAMDFLRAADLEGPIRDHAGEGRPLLGICLGCQLLMEFGSEGGRRAGLGLIKGGVLPLSRVVEGVRIPHTGWNFVSATNPTTPCPRVEAGYYYFNHEFVAQPENRSNVLATTDYGGTIPAALTSGSTLGLQFHPEKSHVLGLNLLKSFLTFQWQETAL